MVKTRTGLVIGSKYQPQRRVDYLGHESEQIQRALLAKRARWMRFEEWLDFFNETIEPLLWVAVMATIIFGVAR
jgi:hypothetical protein